MVSFGVNVSITLSIGIPIESVDTNISDSGEKVFLTQYLF
jgi:hypothetical protein